MSTLSVIDGAISGSQVRVYQGTANLASSTANLDRVELCMGEVGTVKNFCVEVIANAFPVPTLFEVLKNGAPVISHLAPPLVAISLGPGGSVPVAAGDKIAFRATAPAAPPVLGMRFTASAEFTVP